MHPRLINDQHLLSEEVKDCDCGCVIVSTATLKLKNNFPIHKVNCKKKEGKLIDVIKVSGQPHATAT
jgi:hypothetical protein